jgi:hypothetical protein
VVVQHSERDANIHQRVERFRQPIIRVVVGGGTVYDSVSVLIRWRWRVGLGRGCMSDPIALSACAPRTCTISHQTINIYRIPALAPSSIVRSPGSPACCRNHTICVSRQYSDQNDYHHKDQRYHLSAPPQHHHSPV